MRGVIRSIEDHGSVIIVWLDLENGRSSPIHLDHRAFSWLLEGEGCEPEDLIGRSIRFDGEIIEFVDFLDFLEVV